MDSKILINEKCSRIFARVDWGLLYVATILAAGFLVGTGLITKWGQWHSHNFAYYRQVDALLHGTLSLGNNPNEIVWDTVWSINGIHQVWGLGVPVWQLPFELLSRAFGQPFFPGRLLLGITIALVAYGVLRFCSSLKRDPKGQLEHFGIFPALILLVLFPPFVTLCRTRFNVYEEAAAYCHLCGIVLLIWLLGFMRRPTVLRYVALMLFSGLIMFVRPTLLAYGLATLLLASFYTVLLHWSRWKSWMGVGAFCLAGALLFLVNLESFGSGFEFGHSLNLNGIHAMRYASRFDHPFRKEPIWSAATELGSSLFVSGDKMNGYNWYLKGFFPGQSPTFRWREMYFKTYDLSYLIVIVSVWVGMVAKLIRDRRAGRHITDMPYWVILGLWSVVSCLPLAAFYLRCPFMSSRYLIDFAPSFAAALLAFVGMVMTLVGKGPANRVARIRILVLAAVAIWWGGEICTATIDPIFSGPLVYTREQMEVRMANREIPSLKVLPREYAIGMDLEEFGLPYNGSGWDTTSGFTKAAIAVFVQDPGRLELDVAPTDGVPVSQAAYSQIRAKIGLELLRITKIRTTTNGATLEFERPRNPNFQTGLQVAFIGFVDVSDLSTNDSPFVLRRVQW